MINGKGSPHAVLIVEDDQLLMALTAGIVEDAGFEAIQAGDADQAVAILKARSDIALLLTDVAAVEADYGLPNARPLGRTTTAELRGLYFPAGSMRPKVEAACRFVETTGHTAAIGALCDTHAILAGTAGTIVTPTV